MPGTNPCAPLWRGITCDGDFVSEWGARGGGGGGARVGGEGGAGGRAAAAAAGLGRHPGQGPAAARARSSPRTHPPAHMCPPPAPLCPARSTLSGTGIRGSMPASLAQLPRLKAFKLDCNSLGGVIPPEYLQPSAFGGALEIFHIGETAW